MKPVILSNEERQKFAEWCEADAASNELMLHLFDSSAPQQALKQMKLLDIHSCRRVARMLRSSETFEVT